MTIIRSKSQQHQTLTEFYTEAAESNDRTTSDLGKEMLKWIDLLSKKLPKLEVWGLTSLYRLVLMSSDTYESIWSVIIVGKPTHYRVQYLMPKVGAPWKNAYVIGETDSLDEAVELTVTAMQ